MGCFFVVCTIFFHKNSWNAKDSLTACEYVRHPLQIFLFLHLCSLVMFGDGGRRPWTQAALDTRRSCQQLCPNNKTKKKTTHTHTGQMSMICMHSVHAFHILSALKCFMLKISLPKIKVYTQHTTLEHRRGSYKQGGTSAVMICRNAFVMLLNNFWSARLCSTVYKFMKVNISHVGALFVRDT